MRGGAAQIVEQDPLESAELIPMLYVQPMISAPEFSPWETAIGMCSLRHHHRRFRKFSHVKVRKVSLARFHRQLCIRPNPGSERKTRTHGLDPFIKNSGWILVLPFRSLDRYHKWCPKPGSYVMIFGGPLFFIKNMVYHLTLLARLVGTLPGLLIRRRNRQSRLMTNPPSWHASRV